MSLSKDEIAFPNIHTAEITIELKHLADLQYSLTVADNGIGWPHGFDVGMSKSLGMSLMKGLSKQLNGSIQIENKNGLSIRLLFVADEIHAHEEQADLAQQPD